jgi:hypothetical protein
MCCIHLLHAIPHLSHRQLYCVTADNTANNDTACYRIQELIGRKQISHWSSDAHHLPYVFHCPHLPSENPLTHARCLAHVVNLAVIDFMSHVTRIAAVESANVIWEYDPTLPSNRVLSGSLDVISVIRTLAIKVRRSLTHYLINLTVHCRSKLQGNTSSISSGSKSSAGSLSR